MLTNTLKFESMFVNNNVNSVFEIRALVHANKNINYFIDLEFLFYCYFKILQFSHFGFLCNKLVVLYKMYVQKKLR